MKLKDKHRFMVCEVATLFVAITLSGYASDGASVSGKNRKLTWTAATQSGIIKNIRCIAYGEGKFVVGVRTGGGTGEIAYSTDGITWTKVTDKVVGEQENESIVFAGDKFFTSGWPYNIAYSVDGVTWTRLSDDKFKLNKSGIRGPAYVDGKFVIMTYNGMISHSTDGVTWTKLAKTKFNITHSRSFRSIGGKLFVAHGDDSKLAYSVDSGKTWIDVATLSGKNSRGAIAYGDGKFVASGVDGKRLSYSVDGVTWTAVKEKIFGDSSIQSITYGGGKFVAGGNDGKLAYSADGVTWKALDSAFDGTRIYAIAYGNGRFVAVGDNGKIAYSNLQE